MTRSLLLPLALLAFSGNAAAQQSTRDRTVIVISLDGFPAYALEDPNLPVPTLRRLIAEGSVARRMSTVNPAVTWPNHTAMVTGVDASRHGLLVNGTIASTGTWPPRKIEPWIPKEKMVHVPAVYDIAFRAGLTTAQVDWVAIKSAPSIIWEFPEVPSLDGAVEKEMIARGLVDAPTLQQFGKQVIVRRDQLWTAAAVHIILEHKPNLLLFHLLSLDSTLHAYGPGTLAAADAIGFLDSCVARLVDAVRAAGLQDRTTFLVVSDHGFRKVTRQINLGTVLAQANLQDKVHAIAEGGSALVYAGETLRARVRELLSGVEGVAEVAGPERYSELGLPGPKVDPQMSDLFAISKPGYQFSSAATGAAIDTLATPAGTHGSVNTDPEMDAIFIASGVGIRQGVTLDRVRNVDVAPTIAQLLGLQMPRGIQGRAIADILK